MRHATARRRSVLALGVVALATAGMSSAARATPRSAQPSPHAAAGPGTVVFFSYRDSAGSFYSESGAGGPLRLLLAGTNRADEIAGALDNNDAVAWAPNGKHFLYLQLAPDQLWLSDPTGTERRLIARGVGGEPSWSPDGRRIAFQLDNLGIWVAGADGRGARPLTSGALDERPYWSPDGHSIAYAGAGAGECGRELAAVRPSGGASHPLAQDLLSTPTWSPSGKQIAYVGFSSCSSAPGSALPTALYITNRHGRHTHSIDKCADGAPAWSPDGKWIAVARNCGTSSATGGTWIEHPNGTDRRRLSTMVPWTVDQPVAPVWAPDSRRLAAAFADPGGSVDIWVLGINGARRQLTEGGQYGYNNYDPSWQPRNLPPTRLGGVDVSPAIPTDTTVADNVLRATRPVQAIAADGARVVIQYAHPSPSDLYRSIETWDAQSGSVIRYDGGGGDYQAPAIAGDQIAYPGFDGSGFYFLWTATLERPAPSFPAFCGPSIFCDDPIGDAVGKGGLLVFDTWRAAQIPCRDPCSGPKRQSRLFRIADGTETQIASSSGELTPLAVDSDRVLVNEGAGTLAILGSDGTRLMKLTAPGMTEATLQGNDLVVHAGQALYDYDATSGAILHQWPLPSDSTLTSAQDGTALLITNTSLELLRLGDGRKAVVTPPGQGPFHAQLEPDGLFYSYSVTDSQQPGRVAFIPNASLP